ncbi:hypothetical protein [uncultured Veillonella sp.]|uniref:hypothetical protein n=1 Tax=uncultured Veillonella sp. TaxID=159268 RepID=UPI002598CCE6|nr:hypothetical protein [uncultured Veillonella sp.]
MEDVKITVGQMEAKNVVEPEVVEAEVVEPKPVEPKTVEPKAVEPAEKEVATTVTIKVRAMTRKQIKAMRKAGHDMVFSGQQEGQDNKAMFDMVDWILDNVYGDVPLDDLPYGELVQLALTTYNKAYGAAEEVKN